MRKRPSLLTSNWLSPVGRRAVKRVHNRFRDLDERWKSASTGRRTACPTYSVKRLIQQGGAGGFACRSHGHNQWSAAKLNKFPKTGYAPATHGHLSALPGNLYLEGLAEKLTRLLNCGTDANVQLSRFSVAPCVPASCSHAARLVGRAWICRL